MKIFIEGLEIFRKHSDWEENVFIIFECDILKMLWEFYENVCRKYFYKITYNIFGIYFDSDIFEVQR